MTRTTACYGFVGNHPETCRGQAPPQVTDQRADFLDRYRRELEAM